MWDYDHSALPAFSETLLLVHCLIHNRKRQQNLSARFFLHPLDLWQLPCDPPAFRLWLLSFKARP